MFPRVLVVQMDYHKTLPTPKVTSQDWYYSRKLRTHLFGVYVANEDSLHCYFYDDTVAGAGPNEVISLLHSTLMKLTEQYGTFDQLIVWTDSAPSQFKECFFFFYLDHLVKNKYFLRIDLKFLVEGHSYSICDRRFGCIQQSYDTQEKVEVPQEWATLLKNSDLKRLNEQRPLRIACVHTPPSFLGNGASNTGYLRKFGFRVILRIMHRGVILPLRVHGILWTSRPGCF